MSSPPARVLQLALAKLRTFLDQNNPLFGVGPKPELSQTQCMNQVAWSQTFPACAGGLHSPFWSAQSQGGASPQTAHQRCFSHSTSRDAASQGNKSRARLLDTRSQYQIFVVMWLEENTCISRSIKTGQVTVCAPICGQAWSASNSNLPVLWVILWHRLSRRWETSFLFTYLFS